MLIKLKSDIRIRKVKYLINLDNLNNKILFKIIELVISNNNKNNNYTTHFLINSIKIKVILHLRILKINHLIYLKLHLLRNRPNLHRVIKIII